MTPCHLAVLGPTCSWKSDTALILAERLSAEIVSCDSMQVYRGMDVGTGKPSRADLARVRHHLIDCLQPAERCDASTYVALAQAALVDLEGRGRRAILVGGTGLYARSLIYGLKPLPSDPATAAAIESELITNQGIVELLQELETCSGAVPVPEAVRRNPRRLLRAVEVARLCGQPPWLVQAAAPEAMEARFVQYLVLPEMRVIKPRLERRTQQWLSSGWIDETRRLVAAGLLQTPTARQALGYADIIAYLDGGIPSLAELADRISRATVRYARRQRTWFRHQHPGAITILVQRDTSAAELADLIAADAARRHAGKPAAPAGATLVLE